MSRRDRRNNVTRIRSDYTKQHEEQMAQKSREKKLLFRRLTAFLIIFLVLGSLMGFYHLNQRAQYQDKQSEYDTLHERMVQYQSENEQLNEEIEKLSDINYLLQIARKDYFFSKDGEIIFRLPDEEPSY